MDRKLVWTEKASSDIEAIVSDWIDRREEGRKILANFDQKRRHRSYFLIHPSDFFLSCVRCRFKQTADQRRDKGIVGRSRIEWVTRAKPNNASDLEILQKTLDRMK